MVAIQWLAGDRRGIDGDCAGIDRGDLADGPARRARHARDGQQLLRQYLVVVCGPQRFGVTRSNGDDRAHVDLQSVHTRLGFVAEFCFAEVVAVDLAVFRT